jgi:hypothetical protein
MTWDEKHEKHEKDVCMIPAMASARSASHAAHTARVLTVGGLTPSSSTACSMRFTARAPPAPTAAVEISSAVAMV